jgi:DNA-binding CsgD family transcriptional regulator
MTASLSSADVRALLQLLGELRELGDEPAQWRGHLVQRMASLFGACISVASELRVAAQPPANVTNCSEVVTALQAVDHGVDASHRDRFYRELYFTDHETDDALGGIVPLYGSRFTILRQDVVSDSQWDASRCANERFRAFECDDFVMSMVPVAGQSIISSIELLRPRGRRFSDRDRLLLQLLHEELARDFHPQDSAATVRLTPRQRQVLNQLIEGASEKDIASALGVSPHTAHDHVKAIHRAHGARSRGELLAKVRRRGPARVRLVAESGDRA